MLLRRKDVRLIVAGAAWQLAFLAGYFPDLALEQIPGYDIRYARQGSALKWRLLQQLPRIRQAIKSEHQWLGNFAARHQLQGILSDNRYGLWHPNIPGAILTHQLQIKSNAGALADRMLRMAHYRLLGKFEQVWVVDRSAHGLADTLSHPEILPPHTQYLGLLSQFYGRTNEVTTGGDQTLLILLSGPEPQRSLLSDLLWAQVKDLKQKVVFAEGKKGCFRQAEGNVCHTDILQGAALQEALQKAAIVICRAGYSSIMDLIFLDKKAIFIPTPGQTEQEYLGKVLQEKGMYPNFKQDGFSLQQALLQAKDFPFKKTIDKEAFSGFEPVLNNWISGL